MGEFIRHTNLLGVRLEKIEGDGSGAISDISGSGADYTVSLGSMADGDLYNLNVGNGIYDGC